MDEIRAALALEIFGEEDSENPVDEVELKKLGRRELMELLLEMTEREEKLLDALAESREETRNLQEKLEDRDLKISKEGSIAEAALVVSGIFESAQTAADDYLNAIRKRDEESVRTLESAKQEKLEILADAQRKAREIIRTTVEQCSQKEAQSQEEIAGRWKTFQQNLEKVLSSRKELEGILVIASAGNSEDEGSAASEINEKQAGNKENQVPEEAMEFLIEEENRNNTINELDEEEVLTEAVP